MKERFRLVVLVAGAALVALIAARGSISDSLVVRGDSLLYGRNPKRALPYYRRAIAVDSANGVAVDRFAFASLMQRDRSGMNVAATICSNFLQRHPDDWTVRLDRALLFRAVGDLVRAEQDFAVAGRAGRNAQAMAFAGLQRVHWAATLRNDAIFAPRCRMHPASNRRGMRCRKFEAYADFRAIGLRKRHRVAGVNALGARRRSCRACLGELASPDRY